MINTLEFNPENGVIQELTMDGITVHYREFLNIPYVEHIIDPQYQVLNLFVPEGYYHGEVINGYTAKTAPIFLPNTVGGYMPGKADTPGLDFFGRVNAAFYALDRGYVVAAPAIRGRTLKGENGEYIGKAPACIVDYKAAVRYLRKNSGSFPGDTEKIISNGTSAGGALSALLGASGDHEDYLPYLKELGAADASDRIFASSCFCPVTNLEHADMAYEWLFSKVNKYSSVRIDFVDNSPNFVPVSGVLSEEEIQLSNACKSGFRPYLDSLVLMTEDGTPLNEDSLQKQLKSLIICSAQKALDEGQNFDALDWIQVKNGTVVDLDFDAFLDFNMRMKTPLPFDSLKLDTPEVGLFGSETKDAQHFTYLADKLDPNTGRAEPQVIRLMNPMNYIGKAETVRHWRIRHGAADRDTSLVIPVLLVDTLRNHGYDVNFEVPWGIQHMGDYALNELFDWIDSICK